MTTTDPNTERQKAVRRILQAFRLSVNAASEITKRNHSTLEFWLKDGEVYPRGRFLMDLIYLTKWAKAAMAEQKAALDGSKGVD